VTPQQEHALVYLAIPLQGLAYAGTDGLGAATRFFTDAPPPIVVVVVTTEVEITV
jgi:hypothetical protein